MLRDRAGGHGRRECDGAVIERGAGGGETDHRHTSARMSEGNVR